MSDTIPAIGMGMTLRYPQDCYGYVIVAISPSGKTLTVESLATPDKSTGHEPARYDGPFPVWHHVYTDQERESMRTGSTMTVRLNKRGEWKNGTTRFSLGKAIYYRNYSF